MADDFYPFVDSGDPAPDNAHLNGVAETADEQAETARAAAPEAAFATRIAVYDDMISTPRVLMIEPKDVRTYLEETTNTVYRCMKEQGGSISLMVIREIVENFIHAHFAEPVISILDGGNTIRFADQGPGIEDKERAFDFGVTSANRSMKRYIRGTGAGFPMVQQYLENAGGAVSIEDNMGGGTVITVSLDPKRVREIERNGGRGAAVRPEIEEQNVPAQRGAYGQNTWQQPFEQGSYAQNPYVQQPQPMPARQAGWAQQPQPLQAYAQQASAPAAAQTEVPMAQGDGQLQATGAMQEVPAAQAQTAPADQGAIAGQAPATASTPQMPWGQQPAYPPQGMYPQQATYAPMGYPQPGMPNQGWPAQQAPNPYGYAQPMAQNGYHPWPQSFQQPYQMYPSSQQPAAQMMYPNAANQFAQAPRPEPYISERGENALGYLAQNGQCGPTELKNAFGSSVPTWSRELDALAQTGLVRKHGQKFYLTELGQARMNPQQQ